jgi:hypothetical protein
MPDEPSVSPNLLRRTKVSITFALACTLACLLCAAKQTRAQTADASEEAAPPPMKYIPPAERAMLFETHDAKARTRLSLELAETRLLRAAQYTSVEQFDSAAAELGIYQAIVEDAVRFLYQFARTDNRTRDLYKRLDLTLRAHGPRIETIRRSTPYEDAFNVRAAYDAMRRARTAALNAFYGDTVMHEASSAKQTVAVLEERSAATIAQAQSDAQREESFSRLRAAYDLLAVKSKAREAIPELLALLKSDEAFVRGNAAHGLGCLGAEAEPAVPALIAMLKDKNSLVRFSAAEAIRKIGLAAVPALNRATQTDR